MRLRKLLLVTCCLLPSCLLPSLAVAQETPPTTGDQAGVTEQAEIPRGPHGGSLKQVAGVEFETVVSTGGIQLFVRGQGGAAVPVENARGVLTLAIEGSAKRYRYDLLPEGQGSLTTRVNLSKLIGKQLELSIQLFGMRGTDKTPLTFTEVAMIPPLDQPEPPPTVVVSKVTEADKSLIAKQATCPVMDEPLESMGGPIKLLVGEKPLFLCCKGCIKKVKAEPEKFLKAVYGDSLAGSVSSGGEQVREGVFKVTKEDDPFVAAQKKCPVMDEPLDAMGGPYRVNADGKAIYICCPGCAKKIAAEPKKYLDLLAEQGITPPVIKDQSENQ